MTTKKFIFITVTLVVACMSCEKEKIEYKKEYSGNFFIGFAYNNNFIIHDESISYYSTDSNKVFNNLFEHQNGRKLGESVHSLKFFRNWKDIYGIITVEGENMIEIVDKNFISVKQIQLDKPRNISIMYSGEDIILVSYGDAENGGLAVIAPWDFSIADTIRTGNTAGEIYVDNFIYVLSNGENDTDSTMAKIYYGNGPYALQKVEDIAIGKRPVLSFPFKEDETGFSNQSLLIYCLGNSVEKPKIVLFDLIRNNIINSYPYPTGTEYPEHILNIDPYENEILYCSNNKVYSSSLSDLGSQQLLTAHNLISLSLAGFKNECLDRDEQNNCTVTGWAEYYIGISGDNNEGQQYLYRFNESNLFKEYFEVIDSIPINDNARKIVIKP
jgi:hypothetical protein